MEKLYRLPTKLTFFFSLILSLLVNPINAQEEYTSGSLTGTNIVMSNTLTLPDPAGTNCLGINDCGSLKHCSYQSYVALEIGALTDPLIPYATGVYKLAVNFTVTYKDLSDPAVVQSITETLEIGFNKDGGTFINKDRLLFDGGYGISLVINSVDFRDPNDDPVMGINVPIEAELYIGSLIDRYQPIAQSNNVSISYVLTTGEHFLDLNWADISGADSYDLEWTWIDDELIDTDADQVNFRYNSTRVSIENSDYRVSNIYRKGIIVARVRGVGRLNDCDELVASPWDKGELVDLSDFLPSQGDYAILSGHREGFNWQHSRTYAEEGRQKDVMTYFDGTMRSRQSITRLESDNHAIVSENYYDHVGRATVESLPAPFIQGNSYAKNIDYYDNFNKHDGNPYNRTNFEKDDVGCLTPPDTMDHSGSGQYYSRGNTITDGHQAYVPDAKGYPFTQTIFTQDQTGRVRFQGGVGNVHQLGLGKETKYYYGVPEQQELDRLFGNDAGYAQYYEKNLVVDANGQVSVSYMDNKNRVVATALAGANPSQLEQLPSYSETENLFEIESQLSAQNNLNNEGKLNANLEISKQFPVSEDGATYTYNYSFTPQDFTDNCAPDICFDCAYDVKLVLYDECGTKVVENDPSEVDIDPSSLDGTCETNTDHAFTVEATLNIGSYTLNKKLSLDEAALAAYEELYVTAYVCAETEVEIFNNLITNANLTGCVDAACLGLCTAEVDIDDYEDDLEGYKDALLACLNAKIESGECTAAIGEDIDQCGALRALMLSDMSPFGQYGIVTDENNEIMRSALPCNSIYATENIFETTYDEISYGTIMVNVNGEMKSPHELELPEFVTHFEPAWAEFLLPLHPEFAYLQWCEEPANATSRVFDENLLSFTAAEAEAAGYLNPLGMTGTGYDNIIGTGSPAGATMLNTDLVGLENEMRVFLEDDFGSGNRQYSIWDVSYMIALSNIIDIGAILTDPVGVEPAVGMWDDEYGDQLCRSDRFWEVFRGLYASLKLKYTYDAMEAFVDMAIVDGSPAECIRANGCLIQDSDPPPPTNCCACTEWDNINRRFYGYGDVSGEGSDLTGGLNVDAIIDGTADPNTIGNDLAGDLAVECANTCEAYRDTWEEQLLGCTATSLLTPTQLDDLLDEMVLICASGCDPQHPLGAASSPDGTESFELAIQNALPGAMTEVCNDLLITHPLPYDNDIFGGTQPFIDDCVCERYNQVFDEYAVGQSNPSFAGFYNFLQSDYAFEEPSDVLVDIDCACRNADSPYLLDNPTGTFQIPEPFTCVACIDCDQAAALYSEFQASP